MTANERPLVVHANGLTLPEIGLILVNSTPSAFANGLFAKSPAWFELEAAYTVVHEQVHYLHGLSTLSGNLAATLRRASWECIMQDVAELETDPSLNPSFWFDSFVSSSIARIDAVLAGKASQDPNKSTGEELATVDLLESTATLEAIRLVFRCTSVQQYREIRDRLHPNLAAYSVAFEWLAQRLDDVLAYHLLAPLVYLSLNPIDEGEQPVARFTDFVDQLVRDAPRLAGRASGLDLIPAPDLLKMCGWGSGPLYPQVCHSEPLQRGTTTAGRQCAKIVQRLGLGPSLSLFAQPAKFLSSQPFSRLSAFLPPVMIFHDSEPDGIKIGFPYGQSDEVTQGVMTEAVLHGVAEGLIAMGRGFQVYNSCPHTYCRHRGAGLCARFYWRPPQSGNPVDCQFPGVLKSYFQGREPGQLIEYLRRPKDSS